MRIIADTAKSILDYNKQQSTPSQIAQNIVRLPDLNPEIARSLQGRVSTVSAEDVQDLQDIFTQYLMTKESHISDIGAKKDLCASALPLLSFCSDDVEIEDVLELLSRIPKDKQPLFLTALETLMEGQDLPKQQQILNLCKTLSPSYLDLSCILMANTSDREALLHIINELKGLQTSELESLDTAPQDTMDHLKNGPLSLNALKALRYFPQKTWSRILADLRSLPDFSSKTEKELLNHTLQDLNVLGQMHDFLLSTLLSTTDPRKARSLALELQSNLNSFRIMQGSDLYHMMITVIDLSSDTNIQRPKNPYALYRKFADMSQAPMPHINLDPSLVYNQSYLMQPIEMVKQAPKPILAKDLPINGNRERFQMLWTRLYNRIESSPKRQEILDEIKNNTTDNFSSIYQDTLHNKTLAKLFEVPQEETTAVPFETAYLFALVQYADSLPTSVTPPSLLSPQEEFLIKTFASIQGCPAGRSEGVIVAYHTALPDSHKYPGSTIEIAAYRPVINFVRSAIYDTIHQTIRSDSPFMQASCDQQEVSQLSHQSMYVQNQIGRFLGLSSSIQFDLHTDVLADQLVLMSVNELLNTFYHFVTPEMLSASIKKNFAHKTIEEQKAICDSIEAFCQAYAPPIEEESEDEMLYHVHYTDETCTEISGYTLTDKGCAAMLEQSHFITKAFPDFLGFSILLAILKQPDKETQFLGKLSLQEKAFYMAAKQEAANSPFAVSYATQKTLLYVLGERLKTNPSQAHLAFSQLPKNLQRLIEIEDPTMQPSSIQKSMEHLPLIQHLHLELSSEEMKDFIEIALHTPPEQRENVALLFPLMARCSADIYEIVQPIAERIPLEKRALFIESLLTFLQPLEEQERIDTIGLHLQMAPNPLETINKLQQILSKADKDKRKKILSLLQRAPLLINYLSEFAQKLPTGSYDSLLTILQSKTPEQAYLAISFLQRYPSESQSRILQAIEFQPDLLFHVSSWPAADLAGLNGDGILCILTMIKNAHNLDASLRLKILQHAVWYQTEVPADKKGDVLTALRRFKSNILEIEDYKIILDTLSKIPSNLRVDALCQSLQLKNTTSKYGNIVYVRHAKEELRPYLLQLVVCAKDKDILLSFVRQMSSYLEKIPSSERQATSNLLISIAKSWDLSFLRAWIRELESIPYEHHAALLQIPPLVESNSSTYLRCLYNPPMSTWLNNLETIFSFSLEARGSVVKLLSISYVFSTEKNVILRDYLGKMIERLPVNPEEALRLFSLLEPDIKNRVYYLMYEQAKNRGEDTSDPLFGEHAFLNPSFSIENKIAAIERVKEDLTA